MVAGSVMLGSGSMCSVTQRTMAARAAWAACAASPGVAAAGGAPRLRVPATISAASWRSGGEPRVLP
jgi:hypothetical protein